MVAAVAFSRDGKTVLTGSADKTARLWDATTGRPLALPMTHQGQVEAVSFSPDGKTVLTGSADKTARLWDAATSQPLGPPLLHQGRVSTVSFSHDGRTALTLSEDRKTVRLWDVSALPDDPERLATWAEVITGLGLDEQGSDRVLDNVSWLERRDRLEALGGDPTPAPRTLLDPILFGTNPTARLEPGSNEDGGPRPSLRSRRRSRRGRSTRPS